ncbi:MAG: peptidyl-prolyl cis-trans isomerase [Nitrospiria bacterium]
MNKVIFPSHFSPSFLICLFLIAGTFLSFSFVSCKTKGEISKAKTLALVGGDPILESDLNQALSESGQEIPIPQGVALDNLKKDLLEQLIQTKIFLQEAKKENIVLTQAEIDENLKTSKADFSDTEFRNLLKSKGLTYERWVQKLIENQTIQKLEEKATETAQRPNPDEIKEYYNSHIDDYKLKPGVRIRQILVGTEKEANEVHQSLLNGADFAKVASEKSISPDKDLGGDLGILTADQMPEGFEITLTLPINAISPVIKTSYGYHIFRVEEKQVERIIPLSQEGPKISSLLFQERRDKQFAKWAIDLRKRTEIKILSDSLTDAAK